MPEPLLELSLRRQERNVRKEDALIVTDTSPKARKVQCDTVTQSSSKLSTWRSEQLAVVFRTLRRSCCERRACILVRFYLHECSSGNYHCSVSEHVGSSSDLSGLQVNPAVRSLYRNFPTHSGQDVSPYAYPLPLPLPGPQTRIACAVSNVLRNKAERWKRDQGS